jgi:hypothetical protein
MTITHTPRVSSASIEATANLEYFGQTRAVATRLIRRGLTVVCVPERGERITDPICSVQVVKAFAVEAEAADFARLIGPTARIDSQRIRADRQRREEQTGILTF